MELKEGSETSAIRTQTPGNYPEENILHIEHGESLKSRINICIFVLHALVYKKLILAVMSTCLLVNFVVVMSKGRRWHKYVAVECILDRYNSVYPCSKDPSIRLDSSTNTL